MIIAAVIRLQFPPFIWFFRFLYWLAIRASVSLISRVPGVLAIYLSGSLARGEVIFGLSDIDFKIFVCGTKDRSIFNDIRDRFSYLRHLFPMLGPPDEKGIYFLDDFPADYQNYPLIQLLFNPVFYDNRLIWGDHVIGAMSLQKSKDSKTHLPFVWWLKYWMEKLSMLHRSPALCAVQKRYLFYKAVCDAGRAYLQMHEAEGHIRGRQQALEELMKHLSAKEVGLIASLLLSRKSCFRRKVIDADDCYALFKNIIGSCMALLEGRETEIRRGSGGKQLIRSLQEGQKGNEKTNRLKAVCPADAAITEHPWLHIPLSPLDCKYFGCSTYVLSSKRSLSLSEFDRLADFYRSEMADRSILMISDNDHYIYPVYSALMDHWLSCAASDDLTFTFLTETTPKEMPAVQRRRVEKRLIAYLSQLEEMIRSEDIYRIDRRLYMKFIFTAVRSFALYRALPSGKVVLLSSAEEVAAFLHETTPLSSEFIDQLYEEYGAVAENRRPFREAFFGKTRRFIESFVGIAKSGASWDMLASLNGIEDMQRVSISVVVITRSRCAQLKKCLNSVAELERQPDELIVVDNGSTDATADTVAAFRARAPFPVRYLYEPTTGVAVARNAGVRAAACDVVAFIDDDAVAEPRWLSAMENAFLRDPRIGVVGGSIENLREERSDLVHRYQDLVERM